MAYFLNAPSVLLGALQIRRSTKYSESFLPGDFQPLTEYILYRPFNAIKHFLWGL
jgi:hypothetical protein